MSRSFFIFDQLPIVRFGLESLLNGKFPSSKIISSSDTENTMQLIKAFRFDLAVLDFLDVHDEQFTIIKKIKLLQPSIKILIFSYSDDENYKLRCLKSGASGFLNKRCSEVEFMKTVGLLLDGDTYFSKDLKVKLAQRKSVFTHRLISDKLDTLTSREFELARLFITGATCKEICYRLEIAMTTVSTYKKRILIKTNCKNLFELAEIFKKEEMKALSN